MAVERELRIPFVTLLKVALAILLAVIVVKLWQIILMIIIAVLLAVMFDPIVRWLERHHVRQEFSVLAVAAVLVGLLLLFFLEVVPIVSSQVADLARQLPKIVDRITALFPPAATVFRDLRGTPSEPGAWLSRGLVAGKAAIEVASAIVFVLVVAIYLVIEGRRAFSWLIDFAPREKRGRIQETAEEVRKVMLSYVRGSVITASICAVYVFGVLTLLRVPLAVLLTVLAFLFDFIPVVGTIIMMVPATLLGFLISPSRALLVIIAYLVYHVIEAYVLIPRIWGKQMRVSTLTVLLAIAIGGTLLGPIGAVLALPIAAAYPIVERIWLRDHLPSDTVERHEELEET